MPTISADDLHDLTRRVLLAAGADERNASRVADALVLSNLSGVDTHGVFHLPRYVTEIRDGVCDATAWPEIVSETPTSALVSGNWAFGHVVAKFAMDVAIAKAREQNVATVSLVRATHIGRLGEYPEMAVAEGMIAFVWASGYGSEEPVAVPYGGRKPLLHTNPISIGVPAGDETPMVMDFATTTIAGSKARVAALKGEQVPPGSLVDDDGRPTTDPTGYPKRGGMVAFGGHKGYAFMLANEFIGRVLSGADDYVEGERGGPLMRRQGRHDDRVQGRPVPADGGLRPPVGRAQAPGQRLPARRGRRRGARPRRPRSALPRAPLPRRHPHPRRSLADPRRHRRGARGVNPDVT